MMKLVSVETAKMKKFLNVMVLLILFSALGHAQSKTPLAVHCQAEDSNLLGVRYCASLRNVIMRSPRYQLAVGPTPHWRIEVVVAKGPDPTDSVPASAVLIFDQGKDQMPLYRASWILSIGEYKIDSMADFLLSGIDQELN